MAHWAKIENGIVTQVLVGDNNDPAGDEGYQWLVDNLGGTWVKTSYNTHAGVHYGPDGTPDGGVALRKNYARVGHTYDETLDAFIPPKPESVFSKKTGVEVEYKEPEVTFYVDPDTGLWMTKFTNK